MRQNRSYGKKIIRDKEKHVYWQKQQDITILNIYAANNYAIKYIKQQMTELQEE